MASRTINRVAVAAVCFALASCGALPTTATTSSTSPDTDGRATTTTLSESPTTTASAGSISVVLRLPANWDNAVVLGRSDDFPTALLAWEASGSSLDVSLPGEGGYIFWAETPSSDDGLCLYQAQSDPQWKPTKVFDGDSVELDLAGEVCE
jgi:hypothetical protein